MFKPCYRFLLVLLLYTLVCSCAVLHSSEQSDAAQVQIDAFQAWQQGVTGAVSVSHLNDLISHPQIERLLTQSLAANPDIKQAALALQIAQADLGIAAAQRLPSVELTSSAQHSKDQSREFNTGLNVSWVVDIWGKQGDSVTAQQALVKQSQLAYVYARDVLASNIIQLWLQLVRQRQLIQLEQQRLTLLQNNEATVLGRYRKGFDELSDLESARSNSHKSRATLVSYQENLAILERALIRLAGGEKLALSETFDFPSVLVPLTTLPKQDLARRPDLQQAYWAIKAQEYQTTVAYKAMLPSFTLQASLSDSAEGLSQSLLKDPVWTLLSQLSAPLYQGGQLKRQAEVAELKTEQAFWSYRQTLLAAVEEVENALGQERALAAQQAHVQAAVINAQRSDSLYRQKYRNGLVSFINLLSVQENVFDLQSQLIDIVYQRLSNRINLGLALGLGVKQ